MLLRLDQQLFNLCRAELGLPRINLNILNNQQLKNEFAFIRASAYAFINANGGTMPFTAFTEEHPYTLTYPINWAWNTFIVGTFPPITYLRDFEFLQQPVLVPNGNILQKPSIPFYHGNKKSLWLYLNPEMIVFPILKREGAVNEIIE